MTHKILPRECIIVHHLPERLNISQVEYLEKCLAPFIAQSDIHLILDLHNVRLMDCRMVGYLVSVNKALQAKRSVLTLRHLTENVKLLINVLKISNLIHIE
ncbi:MAG: STAS domain-containing protein [Odoribacter sp.]|nr:STAS domain-containing protein [Odoribacter sp.]